MVSIIIPCYNIEDYIGRTINSVIAQTDSNWEIIAVDDGSTDTTYTKLLEFTKTDHKIRLFHQNNLGVSAARNYGICQAKGEWIYFLDGDDLIDVDLVKSLNDISAEIDIVVFNFQKEKNGVVKQRYNITKPETLFIDYLTNRQSIHISSIAIRRRFINNNNLRFDENTSYGEDREFIANIFFLNPNIYFLNKCLFRYQLRNSSAMASCNYSNKRFSSVLACERTYKKLKGHREELKALAVLSYTIARHIKMYHSYNCNDNELRIKLKEYSEKYLKGFHYYGKGHIELYASIAGIMALNSKIFSVFLKLI